MQADDRDRVGGSGHVGPTAYALGFAGLLPQVATVVLAYAGGKAAALGYAVALGYGALILSFLGGMWWGLAMRRVNEQGSLALVAVVPSLVAAALVGWAGVLGDLTSPEPLIALGSAIMLTLLMDRRLVSTGVAPRGWMSLRVPLSLGLGGLTILTSVLAST